jgi:hypothetical protein
MVKALINNSRIPGFVGLVGVPSLPPCVTPRHVSHFFLKLKFTQPEFRLPRLINESNSTELPSMKAVIALILGREWSAGTMAGGMAPSSQRVPRKLLLVERIKEAILKANH